MGRPGNGKPALGPCGWPVVIGASDEVNAGAEELAGTGLTTTAWEELEALALALALCDTDCEAETEADAVALGSATGGPECDGGVGDDGASQYSPTQ